jgi:hypothetical protein
MDPNRHHPPPTHEEVSARARELWHIAGAPLGRDAEFWLAAEARIDRERDEISRALHEQTDIATAA